MATSRYYQPVQIRRQDPDAVQRGLQAGETIGKLLGNLGTAIKGAQKDALANKLMNTEDAPRAALVSPGNSSGGGPQPGGPQPAASGDPTDSDLLKAMAADNLSKPGGTSQDLGTLPDPSNPQPGLGVNMDTNNPQPSMGINADTMPPSDYTPTAADDASFQQAMAAARVGNGPTVGSITPTAPAPVPAAAAPAPRQNVIAPGVPTAGTRPHTGGVQEMELQKEMLAMQLQKSSAARQAAADARQRVADAQDAEDRPLNTALKRAQLATAQQRALNPRKRQWLSLEIFRSLILPKSRWIIRTN